MMWYEPLWVIRIKHCPTLTATALEQEETRKPPTAGGRVFASCTTMCSRPWRLPRGNFLGATGGFCPQLERHLLHQMCVFSIPENDPLKWSSIAMQLYLLIPYRPSLESLSHELRIANHCYALLISTYPGVYHDDLVINHSESFPLVSHYSPSSQEETLSTMIHHYQPWSISANHSCWQ